MKTTKERIDCFILTFKDNSEPVISRVNRGGKYVTAPVQWLHDMTNGRAEFVKIAKDGIEIAIPIGDFMKLKDNPDFQIRCSTLVRLRTYKVRTLLSSICFPVAHFDNRI